MNKFKKKKKDKTTIKTQTIKNNDNKSNVWSQKNPYLRGVLQNCYYMIRKMDPLCNQIKNKKWTHLMKSALKSLYSLHTQNVTSAKKVHELLTSPSKLKRKKKKENQNCLWSPVNSKRDRYEYNTSEVLLVLYESLFLAFWVCLYT
jgi:hypothetical protein